MASGCAGGETRFGGEAQDTWPVPPDLQGTSLTVQVPAFRLHAVVWTVQADRPTGAMQEAHWDCELSLSNAMCHVCRCRLLVFCLPEKRFQGSESSRQCCL